MCNKYSILLFILFLLYYSLIHLFCICWFIFNSNLYVYVYVSYTLQIIFYNINERNKKWVYLKSRMFNIHITVTSNGVSCTSFFVLFDIVLHTLRIKSKVIFLTCLLKFIEDINIALCSFYFLLNLNTYVNQIYFPIY